ncbi:hypothetical protein RB195_009208 [Necator americanus]|uniref:SXP/RAL-2 family protein Ani s 5-like cation-binding domain-containing protein n=1 Tax=Necator americanus TaxID=51031 RepID=A0ABR1CUV4_NECAM
MKVALAILILATNVFCHRGGWNDFLKRHGHGGRNSPHGMMPLPPFLQTARREAQREFFEILGDMELTIAQQKEEVQKWAEKYGFSEKLQDFNEKMEKMNSEAKENATNLIAELPAAMEKGSALMANKNQTILELHSAVKTLYAENPKLYRVLMFIIGQFMPSHDLYGTPLTKEDVITSRIQTLTSTDFSELKIDLASSEIETECGTLNREAAIDSDTLDYKRHVNPIKLSK